MPTSCVGVKLASKFRMEKIKFYNILMLLVTCSSAVLAGPYIKKERVKLPSFVKVCRRNDPNLDICARKSLLALKDRLNNGIPELFIPPIMPLVAPEIKMDHASGPIYLHSTFKNITVNGLANFTINELHIEPQEMRLKLMMTLPNVTMDAKYIMKGRIMMMPLAGEGDFKANFTDVELSTVITAERYKKHGLVFAEVKDVKVDYTLGKTELHLSNLFNGDEELGKRMNMFLNENFNSLSNELRPLMENSIADIVRATTVKLCDAYSFDDLLPE